MIKLFFLLTSFCWANTAPTRISFTQTSWTGSVSTLSTASISWQTNDVIVVVGGTEGGGTEAFNTPTATGLTFTIQKSHAAASNCASVIAAAVAGSSSSGAVTMTISNGPKTYGFGVLIYRNSTGIGNSSEQHTATRTVALTATAADSAIVWGVFDWAAAAAVAGSPTPTTTDQNTQGSNFTPYVFDLTDQISASSISYGVGGSGTGPFSIVVLEVKGTVSGGAVQQPLTLTGVGN